MNNEQSYSAILEVDEKSKIQTLTLEGEIGISNAEELKKRLLEMNFSYDTTIRIKNLETFDLSSLQIIYSLIKTLHSKGLKSIIETDLSDRMKESLMNTGFSELVKA